MYFESARSRLKRLTGRYALVDGIPYQLPVNSTNSPALMSLYSIDADKARACIECDEIHPFRLPNGRGVLVITVIDYRETDIGKYIEYSIAIACTHGKNPAPPLLPAILMKMFNTGQYVVDLPVSSEISVKGGRGIWGMPKHQQSLNFIIGEKNVSAQYDLDGEMAVRVTIPKPGSTWIPLRTGAVNYCSFRGMLMKSYVYFKTSMGFTLGRRNCEEAKLEIGNHSRVAWLKNLDVQSAPFATAFFSAIEGNLDDHLESWFISSPTPITKTPEGLEKTYPLGYGQEWAKPTVNTLQPSTTDSAMAPGISFSEVMAGGFSLGISDPLEGARQGQAKGDALAMHASIRIEDMEKFIRDPAHLGSISGSIDFTPFGEGIPATKGVFNLFSPTDQPNLKFMVYELGFSHQGKDYYLAGKKEVRDEPGLDLWPDTTRLFTKLYEGNNTEGKIIGAGVLSLGVTDLMRMVSTFRVLHSSSALDDAKTLARFGEFFMGALWESYKSNAQSSEQQHIAKKQ